MKTKARELRKDFLSCRDQRSIEENLNRVQDMYGYEEEETVELINESDIEVMSFDSYSQFGAEFVLDREIDLNSEYEAIVDGETIVGKFQEVTFNNNYGIAKTVCAFGNLDLIHYSLGGTDDSFAVWAEPSNLKRVTFFFGNYNDSENANRNNVVLKVNQTVTHTMKKEFLPADIGGGSTPKLYNFDDITDDMWIEFAKKLETVMVCKYREGELDQLDESSRVYRISDYEVKDISYTACSEDLEGGTPYYLACYNVHSSSAFKSIDISSDTYNAIKAAWEAMKV